MSKLLTLGVIGKSLKENEKRVAIHPEHIKRIPKLIHQNITFEKGYGLRFGMSDSTIANLSSGKVATKEEIMTDFDCVLMPKPLPEDLKQIKENAILWGWPHCVQQKEITQLSIDKKLTLIAWEEMFSWSKTGDKKMHTFYKNNEMAGYGGVNHALGLIGLTASYGESPKAVVFSFGSVSRGAIYALQNQGFRDITVYTNRPPTTVAHQFPTISFKQMKTDGSGTLMVIEADGSSRPIIEALSDVKIIVNGTLQDTNHPKMFVSAKDSKQLMKGALIIDISCDEGMGFWCAKPTSFKNPIFEVDEKFYYAVDHSPSYYWDSASWEISEALLPFLPIVMGGEKEWEKNMTISKAIEINKGIIQNPKILSFQNREKKYPHKWRKTRL